MKIVPTETKLDGKPAKPTATPLWCVWTKDGCVVIERGLKTVTFSGYRYETKFLCAKSTDEILKLPGIVTGGPGCPPEWRSEWDLFSSSIRDGDLVVDMSTKWSTDGDGLYLIQCSPHEGHAWGTRVLDGVDNAGVLFELDLSSVMSLNIPNIALSC